MERGEGDQQSADGKPGLNSSGASVGDSKLDSEEGFQEDKKTNTGIARITKRQLKQALEDTDLRERERRSILRKLAKM
eukprot:732330-Amorphochlora_amoeboformis.AAC.1